MRSAHWFLFAALAVTNASTNLFQRSNHVACCDVKCYQHLDYEDRHGHSFRAACSSYLKATVTPCQKTTTITATCTTSALSTQTVVNADIQAQQCPSKAQRRNTIPSYASAQCNSSDFASACSCLGGIRAQTTTLKAVTITSTACNSVTNQGVSDSARTTISTGTSSSSGTVTSASFSTTSSATSSVINAVSDSIISSTTISTTTRTSSKTTTSTTRLPSGTTTSTAASLATSTAASPQSTEMCGIQAYPLQAASHKARMDNASENTCYNYCVQFQDALSFRIVAKKSCYCYDESASKVSMKSRGAGSWFWDLECFKT